MTDKKESYECPICKGKDWTDLDYMRVIPNKFALCNTCGFITYLKTQEEISKGYEEHTHNTSRQFAGSNDIQTKFAKLVQHKHILKKYLEKLPKGASVLDYGCSTGYLLDYIKQEFKIKDVHGIELNEAHAEFGRNEYGINIYHAEKISDVKELKEKKFDLIINFAVLEHIVNPVNAMKEMKSFLKDDGFIYLMTPIWLDTLYNSEYKVIQFEPLFVPEHINCFTHISRLNTFNLSGMEIAEQNDSMYGSIVFLKKCDVKEIIKENPKEVLQKISDTKVAIDAMFKGDYAQALQLWPKNPDAIISHSTLTNKTNMEAHSEALKKALEVMPYNSKTVQIIGKFNMQNKALPEAEAFFEKSIEMNPRLYESYWNLSEIAFIKKDYKKSLEWLNKLVATNKYIENHVFIADGDTVLDRKGKIYAKLAMIK